MSVQYVITPKCIYREENGWLSLDPPSLITKMNRNGVIMDRNETK